MSIFNFIIKVTASEDFSTRFAINLDKNKVKSLAKTISSILILCSVLFSASLVSAPTLSAAENNSYLLDKVITWADGTTEHVQIGSDGFFRLNGEKRKLVGISLGLVSVPVGYEGQFYLSSNMAMYEKELIYLQSIGVRLIPINLTYIKWYTGTIEAEQKAYKDILDLLYRYKMLVIPLIDSKGLPNFGSLQILDFPIGMSGDTLGQWATRWITIVNSYQNVVGVTAENELDIRPQQTSATYTATTVESYLSFLIGILRTKFNGPIISKLAGTVWTEQDIKKTCLNTTDLGAFDCYADNKIVMDNSLNELQTWLRSSGYPTTGWWCMEFNAVRNDVESVYVNSGFIESLFNHGATTAILWTSNWKAQPAAQFFNEDGTPISKMVELASDFNRLQAPIYEPSTPIPTPALALPTNNSVSGNLTPSLTWNISNGATAYGVQVSYNSAFTSTTVNQTGLTSTSYSIAAGNLNYGTQYYWRVNARSSSGNTSNWSAINSFITPAAPVPNAPSALTATPISSSQINVAWQDNSSDETSFKLERKTASGNYSLIATIQANITSYADAALTPGTSYTYRISAASNAGTSSPSNQATAMTLQPTPPPAPILAIASPTSSDSWVSGTNQTMTWAYANINDSNVKVELLKSSLVNRVISASTPIGSNGNGSFSWTVPQNLTEGSDYKIRITGLNSATSAASPSFSVTTAEIVAKIASTSFPNISMTLPAASDIWLSGTIHTISWNYSNLTDSNVKVELYRGSSMNQVISSSTSVGSNGVGSLNWVMPRNIPAGNDFRIRVSGLTSTSCFGESANFSVTNQQASVFAINSPTQVSSWITGTTHLITWAYANPSSQKVKVELFEGTSLKSVIYASTSIGSKGIGWVNWKIPQNLKPGNDYKIRVTDTSNAFSFAESSWFSITSPSSGSRH